MINVEFRIGDKIKVLSNRYFEVKKGTEAKIYYTEIDKKCKEKNLYGVGINGICFWFYEKEIEKIGE